MACKYIFSQFLTIVYFITGCQRNLILNIERMPYRMLENVRKQHCELNMWRVLVFVIPKLLQKNHCVITFSS